MALKKVKLLNANDTAARLADVRLIVVRDPSPRRPDEDQDLVFDQVDFDGTGPRGEISGFTVKDYDGDGSVTLTARKEKVDEEVAACKKSIENFNEKQWLKKISAAEKKVWQCWMNGDMYGVVVQCWSPAERQWKCLECCYQLYGWDDVKNMAKEYSDYHAFKIEAYCVDSALGHVEDMKEDCTNFEVVDRDLA